MEDTVRNPGSENINWRSPLTCKLGSWTGTSFVLLLSLLLLLIKIDLIKQILTQTKYIKESDFTLWPDSNFRFLKQCDFPVITSCEDRTFRTVWGDTHLQAQYSRVQAGRSAAAGCTKPCPKQTSKHYTAFIHELSSCFWLDVTRTLSCSDDHGDNLHSWNAQKTEGDRWAFGQSSKLSWASISPAVIWEEDWVTHSVLVIIK